MITKLEAGQKYTATDGTIVTIKSAIAHNHIGMDKANSTFTIASDYGWYYGDGPLIGKWHLSYRSVSRPDTNERDLIMPIDEPVLEQMSLFD